METVGGGKKANIHSSQFTELAIVAVICLFSALSDGFSVSSRMSSCRFDGGSVNMTGKDMVCGQGRLYYGGGCSASESEARNTGGGTSDGYLSCARIAAPKSLLL